MATWAEDICRALQNLGGVAPLSDIYNEVRKIRPLPHPREFEATIRGAIERSSLDSSAYSSGKNLFFSLHGLGQGVWGLRSYVKQTPTASDLMEQTLPDGNAIPEQVPQKAYRILRDTDLARKIKLLHKNTCQLCGTQVQLNDRSYSEAHHLKPLGQPHYGPDIPENIIVVCPTCHVILDYSAAPLIAHKINTVAGHVIGREYLEYHNTQYAVSRNLSPK